YYVNFSLFFDKKGDLSKITNDGIPINSKSSMDMGVSQFWIEKLKPFITINTPASITLNGHSYVVNSHFHSYFTFLNNSTNSKAKISINKKGEIKIKSNDSKYNDDDVRTMIQKNDK